MSDHVLLRVEGIMATMMNGMIGYQDQLPWHHKADLKRFFKITRKHALLMGARTFLGTVKHNFKPGSVIFPNRQLFIMGAPRLQKGSATWSDDLQLKYEIEQKMLEHELKFNPADIYCIVPSLNPLDDLKNILKNIDEESKLFISGGATIYSRFLEFASKVHVSLISEQLPEGASSEPMYPDRMVYLQNNTKNLLFSPTAVKTWSIHHEGKDVEGNLTAEYLTYSR